jgi:hypothetical protein
VHVSHLFEIVADVLPEWIVSVQLHHLIHVVDLILHEGLDLLRSLSIAIEVEPHEINEGRVDLAIGRIPFQETCCPVLF